MRRMTFLCSVVVLVLAMLGGGVRIAPALAQDATPEPAASWFPLVPDRALCQVEPRSTDELVEIWFHEGSEVHVRRSRAANTL